MSLETEPHTLAGVADPLGAKIGFLIPVFSRRQSNALRVERVSEDGFVEAFVDLEPQATLVYSAPERESEVGALPHWAFGFGDEIVVGQGDRGRARLHSRLKEDFLKERPFLALEVADFLDLRTERIRIAAKILSQLRRMTPETANAWRDLSILTPTIRKILGRSVAATEKGNRRDFQRLTARVRNSVVRIQGIDENLPSEFVDQVTSSTRTALIELAKLYRSPPTPWRLEFVEQQITSSKRKGYDLSKMRALVYIADQDAAVLRRVFSRPQADKGIGLYPPRQFDEFAYQSSEFLGPSFILFRMDDKLKPVWPEGKDTSYRTRMPIGLATRTSSAPRITGAERDGLRRYKYPKVIVPIREVGLWHPKAGLPGEIRDAVHFLARYGDSKISPSLRSEISHFLRASGTGPRKHDDAWAQIYGRCRRLGLANSEGIRFSVGQGESKNPRGRAVAELLFPRTVSETVARSDSLSVDAAVLLSEATDNPDLGFRNYGRTAENVLKNQKWIIPTGNKWQNPDTVVSVGGKRNRVYLSISMEAFKSLPYASFRDLDDFDLSHTNRIMLSEDSGVGAVLSCLIQRRALLVSIRDLVFFPAERGTIWTLFSSQIRRFVSSLPSRSRSNYFAMLVQAAIQNDRVELRSASRIIEALHRPNFGGNVHLNCTKVLYEPRRAVARLILSSYGEGRQALQRESIGRKFGLAVSSEGPTLVEDEPKS